MTATCLQGRLFAAIALLVSGYHFAFGFPDGPHLLPSVALLIVLLGIPHGALDTILAGRTFGIRKPLHWALFSTGYLGLVVAAMAAWHQWPFLLLMLFLAVSASHFSGDLEPDCPDWIGLLYGGAPVVLPTVLHGSEVLRLFSFLAPADEASSLLAGLSIVSRPWLIALSLGAVVLVRRHWRSALEIAAVVSLFTVAPPLVSFTVFFCGMHSARHILRFLDSGHRHGGKSVRTSQEARTPATLRIQEAAQAGLPPMIATLVLLAIYWANIGAVALEPRLVQTVFVGLAALTFPHVILVDGLSRWRNT